MLTGTYEYCGPQRSGKTTLMVRDLKEKVLPRFKADDIFANQPIDIPGIHCVTTSELVEIVFDIMDHPDVRDKVISIDELSQFFMARASWDKDQTRFATGIWQMPKRGILLQYGSNPGNSVDVIIRLGTWVTVVPKYYHGERREDDYIVYGVSWNWDCKLSKGNVLRNVAQYQDLFQSFAPIQSRYG